MIKIKKITILLIVASLCVACAQSETALVKKLLEKQTPEQIQALEDYRKEEITQKIIYEKDLTYQVSPKLSLDVIYSEKSQELNKKQPVLFWIHGGAWIAGKKSANRPYLSLFANKNITVVNIDYSLAPKGSFNMQINEVNKAISYVLENKQKWPIDDQNIFIGGDSAGAELASSYVAAVANPQLIQKLALNVPIDNKQIKGLILHSGIYDMNQLLKSINSVKPRYQKQFGNNLISYLTDRNNTTEKLEEMSAIYWITPSYAKVFITASEEDELTATQTIPFIAKLKANNIDVDAMIYNKYYHEKLRHDFNFDFSFQASRDVLNNSIQFIFDHSK